MQSSYIAGGYHAVTPALAIKNAHEAIEWYKEIFGATERTRLTDKEGIVLHGEIQIADSAVMVSEENPKYNASPKTLRGNSVNLFVYVEDAETTINKALEKGARLVMPIEDHFYGDRSGRIEDPFGYIWIVSTHVRDVSEEEMKKIMEGLMPAD